MRTHLPVVEQTSSLRPDGSRAAVHPADVRGKFARARNVTFVLLIAFYAALPWIPVHGHPAVFLDIEHREFFLFGATFNSQDIWMMVFVLTGAAFGLVYATAVLGRAWCGWACPQTVFLEGIFRRVERFVEGPREKRLRRNAGGWTIDKLWRKTLVHAVYVFVSLLLAHVFLSYFVSLRAMFAMMREAPSLHPESFAVVASLTAVFYFNFAWFREQFCVVVCPYGRLQSVLLDPHSLVVGYDAKRGEPRGKVSEEGKGDCVDCGRCVVVCPTGIDIRNGLQMDCIACTACIDACDEIMVKVHRAPGLIRYDSQDGLVGKPRKVLRPRLALYTVLLLAGVLAASLAFAGHDAFEANVLRGSGPPYVLEDGLVRNAFDVHLVNKRSDPTTFEIIPEPSPGATFVVPLAKITLASLGSADAPIFVTVARGDYHGEFPVHVSIRANGAPARALILPFLGPSE
ncbi:MAG: cytochrome c oxidase accessory protein CcoG [Polyangiaceae bacterium]